MASASAPGNRRDSTIAGADKEEDEEEEEEEEEWQHVKWGTHVKNTAEIPHANLISSPNITPSRVELLNIVRKHSLQLQHPGTEEVEVDPRFWCELLDLFFVRGLADHKIPEGDDDDLVFFVRLHVSAAFSNFNVSSWNGQPFFVRRWAPELGKVIGQSIRQVDWQRSFYLNLICHTSFSLTVAICSREGLQSQHTSPNSSLVPIYKVTKRVYASPSRANFQVDFRSKAVETVPAYPDICFVVDDYDNTFEDVVLMEADHCYCVLLNARGGAAFPPDTATENESFQTSHEAKLLGEAQGPNPPKVTLFSGFVNYDMVRNAYEGGQGKRGLMLPFSSAGKSELLVMRGPGGRGALDVAVSAVSGQNDTFNQPVPSPTNAGAKMGLGTIMRRAATVAKQAIAAAAAVQRDDASGPLPLRCCLMSLSLPWDTLAHDLLYKKVPPVPT
ncbi:unnamed protein product [Sphagnum tenellum]